MPHIFSSKEQSRPSGSWHWLYCLSTTFTSSHTISSWLSSVVGVIPLNCFQMHTWVWEHFYLLSVFLFYTGHSWDLSINWSFSWLIVLRVGVGEWIKHTLLNPIGLNENKKYNVSKYVGMMQKQCSEGCFQQWMLILEMRKSLKLITQVSTSRV